MASFAAVPRVARVGLAACTLALTLVHVPAMQAQNAGPSAGPAPNYALAAQWMPQRVGRMVFDTSVTPRWLEHSERFWYAYQTREGRKFYIVDPVKKTRAPLFDHAKLAASLTMITRIPYDAQHLPFSSGRFIRNDSVFAFEVQVPREAVLGETPRKITTTDESAGVDADTFDEPQQGQRGRGAGARPAARHRRATGRCTSNTTWPPPASRSSRRPPPSACRAGARNRQIARRSCSPGTTTSTSWTPRTGPRRRRTRTTRPSSNTN